MKKWIGPVRLATWGPGVFHGKGAAISFFRNGLLLSLELHFERRKPEDFQINQERQPPRRTK